nr:MAG TPA: hypothetical protein [Caudoviricetes sp.]
MRPCPPTAVGGGAFAVSRGLSPPTFRRLERGSTPLPVKATRPCPVYAPAKDAWVKGR